MVHNQGMPRPEKLDHVDQKHTGYRESARSKVGRDQGTRGYTMKIPYTSTIKSKRLRSISMDSLVRVDASGFIHSSY
jgi:hypothetical protein